MNVVTATAAGVAEAWVASVRPGALMLATAVIARANGVLDVGDAPAAEGRE